MKKILFAVIYLVGSTITYAQDPALDPNWEQVFIDNFNNLDTSLWITKNYFVHGSSTIEEPQIYMDDNVNISNGILVLEAKKTDAQGIQCPLNNCSIGGTHYYSSGEIMSKHTYRYGYYEIYTKIPSGQGYWPAFWLWNDTNCWYNEIDIFEGIGCLENKVTCCVHWNFDCPRLTNYTNNLPDTMLVYHYSQEFHWYGLEWSANRITWYIDRQKVRSIPNDMDNIGIQNPMFIIINLALLYNSHSCHVDENYSVFPNRMFVDQVNLYRLKCDKNTVVNEINYNNFDYSVKKSITLSSLSSLTSGQNIFLKATDFIELQSGFEAPIGAQLSLQTTTCE